MARNELQETLELLEWGIKHPGIIAKSSNTALGMPPRPSNARPGRIAIVQAEVAAERKRRKK